MPRWRAGHVIIEVDALAGRTQVRLADVAGLERMGRIRLADELFKQCDSAAHSALLQD